MYCTVQFTYRQTYNNYYYADKSDEFKQVFDLLRGVGFLEGPEKYAWSKSYIEKVNNLQKLNGLNYLEKFKM